ncbi:hypothetical protein BGZ70_002778 [Mortierella alpina]|uniref:GDP-fucose protein O-fucosyltransferase 2 n=1 Tax=Mortierella alpina TaxID=64518 RepID=A0A9P6M7B2_MORAP|nr:hypothetical protein BGZ70_002778 [Mortierella alpina]
MKSTGGLGTNVSRRSLSPRALILLAVIIFASGWTLISTFDFQVHFNSEASIPTHTQTHLQGDRTRNSASSKLPHSEETPVPAVSGLDPAIKYLSFLPFAGLTNQFIGLEAAAFAAKQLNRTLIIPPIISNTHDHENTHQRWSQFLDLPRFTELTGIQVIEWDTVRPLSHAHHQIGKDQALWGARHPKSETEAWSQVAQNVTCQIIYGYGAPDLDVNISARFFAWHFLFRLVFVRPPARKPKTPVYDHRKIAPDNSHEGDLVVMDDLVARYRDYDDETTGRLHLQEHDLQQEHQILFLSNTFKIKDPFHNNRYWLEVGRHLHFVPQLMEYATMRVNQEVASDKGIEVVPNNDPEEDETKATVRTFIGTGADIQSQQDPKQKEEEAEVTHTANITAPQTRVPHIAVHLRRGDIVKKCAEKDKESCLLPFAMYEEAVERARVAAAKAGETSHLPVVVTTDTDSEDDFQKIRELGWHRLDHAKYDTKQTWGSFGPAMVDAGILAHADVFVGSGKSTMSRIAAARQKSWYDRESLYPQPRPKMRRRTSEDAQNAQA